MGLQISKYSIKIPQDISVIYCENKKILTVIGPLKRKSIKLKLRIATDSYKKILSVSPLSFFQISNTKKKKIKMLRTTTIAQIKHLFIESSVTIFQKLTIVGVGYRADFANALGGKLLTLKLGYSHSIYVRIPKNLSLNCLTKTKFCIMGNSYSEVSTFSAKIRAKKIPEPYKGKGILYENEKITLKEGKKV
jgi:large subunit ribosomal protein L6